MKHIIYGTALLFIVIMVIAGAMIVSGKDVRENELDKALNTAVEQTLEQLKKEGGYEIKNPEELIADFQQTLLMHISSDSRIQVNVLTADVEKGVLDVEVMAQYQTIRGTGKQALCRKTVILEEYSERRGYCAAQFVVDGTVYEKYSAYQGSKLILPAEPVKNGYVFRGWKDSETGAMFSEDMRLEKDATFHAVFRH
ncbi:hypothetical protein D3Z36_14055 [Lachnospiraceae bacterium]|nr:hypothetical protein [Lachnospiraceae bacterium]